MTFKGIDLTPLLTGLLTIIGGLLTFVSAKVAGAANAAKDANTAAAALTRVGALVTTLLGRAWDTLTPKIQAAIADGKVTDAERAELEDAIRQVVYGFIGEDELKSLADALHLPLPGLIAKIASMALDTFTKAHDPGNQTVSAKAFPVAEYTDAG